MKKIKYLNTILFIILFLLIGFDVYQSKRNFTKLEKNFNDTISDLYQSDLQNENNTLKRMLELKGNNNFIVVSGKFSSLYDEFIIDKGKNDNLKEGSAVINEIGLVGIIRNSNNNYSNVELLENLNTKISIKVNNNYGVLERKDNALIITGILASEMKTNDKIYTSGLTDIPENVYIGKIKEITNKDNTFETTAIVSLENDYKTYKYLMVVSK